MSRWESIKIGVHVSLHQPPRTQRNTLPRLWSLKHGPIVDWNATHQSCLYCCSLAQCRIHNIKRKPIVTTFFWAITAKGLRLPTTGHTSSAHTLVWPRLEPFLRVPLNRSNCLQWTYQPLVALHRTPDQILNSSTEKPSLNYPMRPRLLRRLAQDRRLFALQFHADRSRLVHPLCRCTPTSHVGPTPSRSTASAVEICEQIVTLYPNLRGSLRMYTRSNNDHSSFRQLL